MFGAAWNGRKYSIKSATALRAFVRVAPDVVRRLDQEHADRTDFRAIGRVIAPWGRRIGDLRFETEGAWKRGGTTVDSLTKELRLALQYPEGASVCGLAVSATSLRRRLVHVQRPGCRHPRCRADLVPNAAATLVSTQEKGAPPVRRCPTVLRTARLPSNSRLPAVNIQAACTTL